MMLFFHLPTMGHGEGGSFCACLGMLLAVHGLVYLVILPVLLNGMN